MDNWIIQRPERQTRTQRWTFAVITMLAWWAWVALWAPIWTWLGTAYRIHLPAMLSVFLVHLGNLALLVGIPVSCTVMLAGWASYNYLRFRRRCRRRVVPRAVALPEAAERLEAPYEVARTLADHGRVVLHFADHHVERAEGAEALPVELTVASPVTTVSHPRP